MSTLFLTYLDYFFCCISFVFYCRRNKNNKSIKNLQYQLLRRNESKIKTQLLSHYILNKKENIKN